MLSQEFQDYFDGVLNMVSSSVGSKNYARNLGKKNYFRIKTGFYEDENPKNVAKEIVFSVKESINESKILNEAKGISEPIRKVVRQIIDIVKSKNYGSYSLPEDALGSNVTEYDFDAESEKFGLSRSYGIPPFSVSLTYSADMNIDEPYMINAAVMGFVEDDDDDDDGMEYDMEVDIDDDEIGMVIIINPKNYPQLMYDLIADVNDLVAHELEHIFQVNRLRPDDEIDDNYDSNEDLSSPEYYMQKHEVPAELKGLKRIAKLRNQSIEQVMREWFKRHKYAHQMEDDDVEKVIKYLLSKYEERYGTI